MTQPRKIRCPWATTPLYQAYHDNEWGRPEHKEQKLFEMLILETMQAGLSWITVLNKREAFREAFDGFDYHKVAKYDEKKVESLMQNPGIIRNRLKIKAAIANAQAFIQVQKDFGSFDAYIWSFVDGKPIQNHFASIDEVPATTPLSDRLSKELKKRGFQFVGSTTIYAYMQAIGMVNDHLTTCHCYVENSR